MVTVLVFSCSHMQRFNLSGFFVLMAACGLAEKPVGRLNNPSWKPEPGLLKQCNVVSKLEDADGITSSLLLPNRVLNLIIHLLFILLPSSQYQHLARAWCSRCFVTRGVTLNCCQRSWSHRLNQKIQEWLMFTEWLDLSGSVLLRSSVLRDTEFFFSALREKKKLLQGDNLELPSDSLNTHAFLRPCPTLRQNRRF